MMCKTCQERGVDPSRCIPRGRQRCSECYEKHTTCNWAAGGWPGKIPFGIPLSSSSVL